MVSNRQLNTLKMKWNLPTISLIILSISPAFLLGDGNRPLGLIFFMGITPLFAFRKSYDTTTFVLLAFCGSIALSGGLINSESTRWSTILFSFMFASLYISYVNSLKQGRLQLLDFLKVCKFILFAYFFTLIIQQLCVLLGIAIFNGSNYNPRHPWKLNALAAEPSHSARIIGILMLAYLITLDLLKRSQSFSISRSEKLRVWFAFLWCMFTLGSATGAFMLVIVISNSLNQLDVKAKVPILLIVLIAPFFFPGEQLSRAIDLASAFLSLDYNQILAADHSGGLRIAPLLFLLDRIEVFSFNGFFGHGIDSVSLFMSDYIGGVNEGFSAGGLIAFWYEYGFLSFALFSYFSIRIMYLKGRPLLLSVWIFMVFIAGVNGQMIWLAIILLTTLRFFSSQIDRSDRNLS